MATYPGGVFSPSAKSAGQTIQASWFNDPDAEIVAVENALLNGIAHAVTISTGGLTVSTGGLRVGGASSIAGTLQVTGNSTITGGLTVSGGSTISGAVVMSSGLTVTGGLTVDGTVVGPARHAIVSIQESTVALTGSFAALNWTTEDKDASAMHSTASNSSRLNLNSSGLWMVGCHLSVDFAAIGSTCSLTSRIVANDADAIAGAFDIVQSTGTQPTTLHAPYYATDTAAYVTVQAKFAGSATVNVTGSTGTGLGPTRFWAVLQ